MKLDSKSAKIAKRSTKMIAVKRQIDISMPIVSNSARCVKITIQKSTKLCRTVLNSYNGKLCNFKMKKLKCDKR